MAVVGPAFDIILVFTDASSEQVLGLTDVCEIAHLAPCSLDDVLGVTATVTSILKLYNAASKFSCHG